MKITCVEREYRFDLTGEHHRDQTRVVYLLPAKSIDFAQTLELDVRLFGFIDPPTKWIDNLLDEIDYSAHRQSQSIVGNWSGCDVPEFGHVLSGRHETGAANSQSPNRVSDFRVERILLVDKPQEYSGVEQAKHQS